MSPIQKFYIASSAPYKQYTQNFTSSSTWTCPVGTTEVEVFAVGGGGGSGGLNYNTSQYYGVTGGGGGGEVVKRTITVSPGTTYNVTVGAGGAGGNGTLTGQMGGMSMFNGSYTLINGILEQPNHSNQIFRYYSAGSYSLTSPPPYSNSSWTTNTPNEYFSGTTPSFNSATSNGGMSKVIYLGGGNSYNGTYFWVAVKPNTSYALSGYIAHDSGTATASARIEWYTSLYGSEISSVNGTSGTSNTSWNRFTAIGTSPSNATYALVRFATQSGSGTAYLSGPMMEEGSSVTTFKSPGFNAPAGSTVVQGLGLITESSNTVIAGGGGGAQSISPLNSANWFNGFWVTRPEYSGFGGGHSFANSSSFPMVGGTGASYSGNTPIVTLHINNYTNTSTELSNSSNYRMIAEGLPSGSPAYYTANSAGVLHLQNMPEAYDGFYAPGGMGGRYSSVSNTFSMPMNTSIERNGMVGSGAGASGVVASSSTGANRSIFGATGGSGTVILKWMGQA